MGSYIEKENAVKVAVDVDDYNSFIYGYYLVDDPNNSYFKYKDKYYLKKLLNKYPKIFKKIGYKKDFED
jgi:hypothetical protein